MRVARGLGLAALVASGLLSGGCPDTAVIETPLGNIQLEIEVNPPATDRFEIATLQLTAMRFVPADPATAAAAQGKSFGFTDRPVSLDLNTASTITVASVSLPPGTYKFTELALVEFHLEDRTVPLPPSSVCIDQVRALSDQFSEREAPQNVKQTLTPPLVVLLESGPVSVTRDGLQTFRVKVNGQAFIDVVKRHFTGCRTTGTCTANLTRSAPCLNLFLPNTNTVDRALMQQEMASEVFSITPAP